MVLVLCAPQVQGPIIAAGQNFLFIKCLNITLQGEDSSQTSTFPGV